MRVDLVIAEIGSTTTLINAFSLGETPRFLGQGQADTSVEAGDVRLGLQGALCDLAHRLGAASIEYDDMLASSSAAGGLKMCVHGLVYDMTVHAATAAALGAGAVVRRTTAGRLTKYDLEEQRAIAPNLVLLAGGTDGGERETTLYNAALLAHEGTGAPVLYAGNVENQAAIRAIFRDSKTPLYVTENVYPRLDELNVEPARRVLHDAFEAHIVNAPGMTHIRDMVTGAILPTPGAVMEAARLLYEEIGDLLVVDVGGATTDVHSVTAGSEEILALQTSPEPFAKRTVEGDLGVYVNARTLIDRLGADRLSRELGIDTEAAMQAYRPVPETEAQRKLTSRLCLEAGRTAIRRHAGVLRRYFTPEGRRTSAEGKDCTQVKTIVATGGALTRLPERVGILRALADGNTDGAMLYPKPGELRLAFDETYIMASLGVLAKTDPHTARKLLKSALVYR